MEVQILSLKSKSRTKIGVRKGKDSSFGKHVVGDVCIDGTDYDAMELDYDDDCFEVDREDYDLLQCEDEDDICVEMEKEANGFVTFDDTIVIEALGTTTYSQVYRGNFSYDISSIFQQIVILQHEM